MNTSNFLALSIRDARRSSRALLILGLGILLGVAAIVALDSLSVSLQRIIGSQERNLLGADIVFASSRPFSEEAELQLAELPGVRSRELLFASMLFVPKNEGSRLIQLNAISPGYPFYGALGTSPANALEVLHAEGGALVEAPLALQFELSAGDAIQIGTERFTVRGIVEKVPGGIDFRGSIAPRVFIRNMDIQRTGLLQRGSRFRVREYIRLESPQEIEEVVRKHQERAIKSGLTIETAAGKRKSLGDSIDNVADYLNLTAWIAIMLGAVGVSSASWIFVSRKIRTLALLRAIGGTRRLATALILIQVLGVGFLAASCGVLIGVLLQFLLPGTLKAILPVDVPFELSVRSIGIGYLVGIGITLLASLPALIRVFNLSPLAALRVEIGEAGLSRKVIVLLLGIGVAGSVLLLYLVSGRILFSFYYSLGLLVVVSVLWASSLLCTTVARRLAPRIPTLGLRQGIQNLFRPGNQTTLVQMVIGVVVFLCCNILILESTLQEKLRSTSANEGPNTLVFDIQEDQRQELSELVKARSIPVLAEVPVVSMRLARVKGESITELRRKKGEKDVPDWALTREYRSTYRSYLSTSEKVVAGEFRSSVEAGAMEPVPISIEEGLAEKLSLTLGDTLTFDVQGMEIESVVGSIRKVDWQRVDTNFFFVFPEGVLEQAPRFYVMLLRTASAESSAEFQREIAKVFPTVSLIDLSSVLKTIQDVSVQIHHVLRVMGIAILGTSLLLVLSSIWNAQRQRVKEQSIFKVLGASRRVIFEVICWEYLALAFIGCLVGFAAAVCSSWLAAQRVFQVNPTIELWGVFVVISSTILGTLLIGFFGNAYTYGRSSLDILRQE